jgi:hypothetical protein
MSAPKNRTLELDLKSLYENRNYSDKKYKDNDDNDSFITVTISTLLLPDFVL